MMRMARLSLLAMGLLVLLAGCGGGGDNSNNLSQFDAEIHQSYRNLQSAVEREDVTALTNLVSADYLQDGTNAEGFLTAFENFFTNYNSIQMDYTIVDIGYDDDRDARFAEVTFDYTITGVNPATGRREVFIDTSQNRDPSVMDWRFENGVWRMIGDQVRAASIAQSSGLSLISTSKAIALLGRKKSLQIHPSFQVVPRH